MLLWIILGGIVFFLVIVSIGVLADITLVRRTARLLESGADPSVIVKWHESLWERPAQYRDPAQQLIMTSTRPNATEAARILRERRAREQQISGQYGTLLLFRDAAVRWPPICARCGQDLPAHAAVPFTATAVEYQQYGTGSSTRTGKLDFPVCSNETCVIDPETKLKRKEPGYTLPMVVNGKGIGGGTIYAHRRFLQAAKALNPELLSGNP